ncbi:MAG: peptidoglycan-associated lipoprotein Pal [Myxococcales bacterium]|nr:peptidoglycan-associated lipoprotein Pal [Myxococcales bacterium]MDH5306697.1 peptidoglycan-associated lipoprotein Pal [Myxococcales bacterium]MDH5565778.1 peptidoglycan-associated lipoprotein Pal [Myxococcales bacterium]
MKRGSIVRFSMIVVMAGVLGLMACASKPKPAPAPDTGSEWSEAPTPAKPAPTPPSAKVNLQTVYFDFDRAEIREDARPVLRGNAKTLSSLTGNVTIEGHCDERGSAEYNLALGERRANAVKRYLVDLGVSSARLRTVSFGEERPAVQGHDESAWRYNRRADFVAGQ